jgi:Mycothiol maleylpyruvate isomerase N-terminal domain
MVMLAIRAARMFGGLHLRSRPLVLVAGDRITGIDVTGAEPPRRLPIPTRTASPKEATMSEMILEPPTVTAPAERLLAVLRRCHDELAARVCGLGEAGLTGESYCAGWSLAQVLSHLGSGAEIALAQLQAARTGATPPGPACFRAVWAR